MITLVKLGGSFITDKKRPETVLKDRLDTIADELSKVPGPKMVIHGGGSFGHYNALKYGVDNPLGISKTRMAMFKLSMEVCKALDEHGLKPIIFPGGSHFYIRMMDDERVPTAVNFYVIEKALQQGNVPVTFGDITYALYKRGARPTVISGDEIAYAIVVFTRFSYNLRAFMISDVDGIYRYKGGPKIKKIYVTGEFIDENGDIGEVDEIKFRDVKDATGGMKAKLQRAMRIARYGVNVMISDSILKAIRGEGTLITWP